MARALLAGGDEAQNARWLPGIARGEPLCAIAVTEPDCGSDVAAVRLRASPTPGGFLLNGAKTSYYVDKRGPILRFHHHLSKSLLLSKGEPKTDI